MAKSGGIKEQTIILDKFTTVNTYFRPYKIPNNHIAFGMNVDFTEDGKIKQRAGTELVYQLPSVGFLDTWKEVRNGQSYEKLIAICDTTIYLYNDSTQTFDVIKNDLSSAQKWGGAGYIGNYIFSNGQNVYLLYYDSGKSSYVVEDITTSGVGSGTITPPPALLYQEFASRMFAAGDGTENIYWTNIGDIRAWNANDFVAFGGQVVALKAIGDYLYVGTDRGLFKVSQTGDATVPFKVDMINTEPVIWNGLIEIGSTGIGAILRNGKILVIDPYIQSGSQSNDKVGLPIQDYLGGIQNQLNSVRRVGKKYFIGYRETNPIYTALGVNTLVFHLDTVGFSFYSIRVCHASEYKGEIYFIDNNNYKIMKFNDNLYQDDGQDFETYIITPILTGDSPEYKKNWRWLFLSTESRTKTTFKVEYTINMAQFYRELGNISFYAADGTLGFVPLGEFVLGGSYLQKEKMRLDVNSNGMMLKISRSSSASDFQINSIKTTYYVSYRY